jgi:hypothetical protein
MRTGGQDSLNQKPQVSVAEGKRGSRTYVTGSYACAMPVLYEATDGSEVTCDNISVVTELSFSFITEVERTITPHTSYEELVAQQSAEIEEIMRNEVQRFYDSWNQKLEDLKYRNSKLRSGEELTEDHHETFGEEKQKLSDGEAEEVDELSDDFNEMNKSGRDSPFA